MVIAYIVSSSGGDYSTSYSCSDMYTDLWVFLDFDIVSSYHGQLTEGDYNIDDRIYTCIP